MIFKQIPIQMEIRIGQSTLIEFILPGSFGIQKCAYSDVN